MDELKSQLRDTVFKRKIASNNIESVKTEVIEQIKRDFINKVVSMYDDAEFSERDLEFLMMKMLREIKTVEELTNG